MSKQEDIGFPKIESFWIIRSSPTMQMVVLRVCWTLEDFDQFRMATCSATILSWAGPSTIRTHRESFVAHPISNSFDLDFMLPTVAEIVFV